MRKFIFSMALCMTMILSGCAQKITDSKEFIPHSDNPPVRNSDAFQSEEATITPVAVKQLDWSDIKGKINGIYPVGDSKVLVFAEQVSLYDLAEGNIVAAVTKPDMRYIRVLTLDSGYAILGQTVLEGSSDDGFVQSNLVSKLRAILYDENLVPKSEVDIGKLVGNEDFLLDSEPIALSPDGNHLAFATMKGITLYDLLNQKSTRLIDFTGDDENVYLGISVIEQLRFTNNGKTLAFKAQSLDIPAVIDKPSFDTVGTINIDGSGLTNKKPKGYYPKKLTSYSDKLMVAEDIVTASGRMMVIDTKTGEEKIHLLSDKNEGGNIYGSDKGEYFASSVRNKTSWTVRIYETNTGKLVKEEMISNDGEELYGINDPMICVSDDSKTCLVLLGNKQEAVDTKIAFFSF